jgi:peptidoglycan/xylan/chitin deacetylase (PgdA/CDA1 family)
MNSGKLIISLDYELMWGVRDKRSIENYGDAIKGVKKSTTLTLELFKKHQVSATYATVGFLFHQNKQELLAAMPALKPTYADINLSPYPGIENYVGENEFDDPYYFGYELTNKIKEDRLHELATHTYSHYYCLESGQTIEQFKEDMKVAMGVAKKMDVALKSIVFPRNQYNDEYLDVCKQFGIISYRGNEEHFIYTSGSGENQTPIRRALRLIDAYFNITGYHCYDYDFIKKEFPFNIPSSRFLRPYNKKLSFLEGLKLNRIKKAMTHAAKKEKGISFMVAPP